MLPHLRWGLMPKHKNHSAFPADGPSYLYTYASHQPAPSLISLTLLREEQVVSPYIQRLIPGWPASTMAFWSSGRLGLGAVEWSVMQRITDH